MLGASGSGKTTLLRVIAGFERIESGVVRLGTTVFDDGRSSLPPERRRMGYVPQDGALFPHLRVAANVAFGMRRRADRRKVGDLLEAVGLTGLERRYPHQLSGGQQQRVALARALAIEPEVVLLDEPFSALDAAMRASVRREVAEILRARGTTTVLVTHDQDEALSMADRVAVLRDGRIVADARPEDLYRSPLDAELAGFLGEANLLPGTVSGGVAETALGRLVLQDGSPPPGPGRTGPRWCWCGRSSSRSGPAAVPAGGGSGPGDRPGLLRARRRAAGGAGSARRPGTVAGAGHRAGRALRRRRRVAHRPGAGDGLAGRRRRVREAPDRAAPVAGGADQQLIVGGSTTPRRCR